MTDETFVYKLSLKSPYWEGYREFKVNPEIATIDREDLENELVNSSAEYSHVFQLYEWARYELEEAEINLSFIESNMYEKLKKDAPKATETHLKHKLASNGEHKRLLLAIAELKNKERTLYVLVKAVDKKCNQLRSLNAKFNAEFSTTQ